MKYQITNLHKKILGHTVLLFNPRTEENGSGVLVQIFDKIFVLTASHIVEDSEMQVNLGLKLKDTKFTILNKWIDKNIDVGFIELKPFEVDMLRIDLISPYKILAKQETEVFPRLSTLALCGFPNVQKKKYDGLVEYSPILLTCAMMHSSEWSDFIKGRKNPKENFVLFYGNQHNGEFRTPEGMPMEAIKPYGLSGGGVWYIDRSTENSETPFYSFLGVQTSYVKGDQVLIGSFVESIVDRIAREYNIKTEQRGL